MIPDLQLCIHFLLFLLKFAFFDYISYLAKLRHRNIITQSGENLTRFFCFILEVSFYVQR